ncbi:hypothetical protein AYK20_07635 [Thermoplasmatales archaeon SG8-52-1]|nr:MAG: hypothetical protein AYK20_07635 [Thermoplasmatales archaeon SG8-52-1]
MGCKMEIKKINVILVVTIILAAFTPHVLAATTDDLIITFDPDGEIDIDVNISQYDFGSIQANSWTNTSGGTFTLYNNGTVAMDTRIKTNATTDETDMSLNASGVAPAQDEYAIYIEGLDLEQYLLSSYNQEFDQQLLPADSKTFDVCLLIGVNLSANHSQQTTTISFEGSQT